MQFPPTPGDISLWLAITAIILLATAELISPHYGQTNLIIEKGKLRKIGIFLSILFMISVIVRIYRILIR